MQYLFGMHPVLEAVKAGKKFDKVLLKQGLEGVQFRELMELLKENEIPFQFVPGERLNRAVRGSHQGVLAYISQIDYVDIEQLVNNALGLSENPLLVILDGVSDVRNLGAIARSLECAGGQGIIVPAKGGAAINADAVKASAGALNYTPVAKVTNLGNTIEELKEKGLWFVCADLDGTVMYNLDLKGPIGLVIGSEGEGVGRLVKEKCDFVAKIPMKGDIDSLNASVAAGILAYEIVRQRG